MTRLLLPAAFAVACAVALGTRSGLRAVRVGQAPQPAERLAFAVQWRFQMSARPNAPACLLPAGWVVTDEAGGVTALSADGARLWQRSFSNQIFAAAAFTSKERVVVASQQGQVTALRPATGEVLWTAGTDARFQHQPLGGVAVEGEPLVRLVSQEDGRLFCFRLRDGACVWKGEATNRCDGEPAAWEGVLAYGNCDGAVYLFDAAKNMQMTKIEVGGEDQMAGGMLSAGAGLLVAGTRQGNLVVVDGKAQALKAQVKVSSGEAFVKPALAFGGLIVMGTQEGELSFWRFDGDRLQPEGRVPVGAAVDQLDAYGGRLFVLAGGALHVMDKPDGKPERLALGDEAYGLKVRSRDSAACVADGAIVGLKGSE